MLLMLYCILFLAYFSSLFYDSFYLQYGIGILAILSWIFSFKNSYKLFRIISIIFMVIGLVFFVLKDISLMRIPLFMTSTITMLAILFVLPFINSVIIIGRYDRNVNKLLNSRVKSLSELYFRSSLVSFLLGSILNLATIPLIDSVLKKNLKDYPIKLRNKFISSSLLRGYALCLIWSPMEILVAISIETTETTYLEILPWLLFCAFTLLMIDWFSGQRFNEYKLDDQSNQIIQIDSKIYRKIIQLIIYLIAFITVIIFANKYLNLGFLATVSIVILPYSLIWALSIKRFKSYIKYTIPMWKARTLGLNSYIVLFISVGFFTTTLSYTGYLAYVQKPIELLSNIPIALFFTIQFLFLGFAMIGFHPLVTISLLAVILEGIPTEIISPVSLAIVLITSGLSTVMAGPYNVSVSLMGTLLQVNPYRISLWNIRYALLFSTIGSLTALVTLYIF
ncbi:hypothetical protein [Bacillus sp. Marseille-P3661]|uniref:hypothetical protein n=1 Tax=Bacillus sp. Marseille-P3661 TaxID=1936234 RepID=UPI000C84A8CF|nr:hypothetical protein [Bacillus sp. Marseille-P3661]